MTNIWTTASYIYRTTSSGLSVYDYTTGSLLSFTPMLCSSVWASDQYVYVGTTNSGVLRSVVSGTMNFVSYKSYPDITANKINYLHGNGDYLCIVTESGVDRYNTFIDDRVFSIVDGIPDKCFQLSNGDYYITTIPEDYVIGLDDDLARWNYVKTIELSTPIPFDDYQLLLEIHASSPYNLNSYTNNFGADVRILNDTFECVSYYIEYWDDSLIKIWVKLNSGVEKLYILYGNPFVTSTSSAVDTFKLFDDFDDVTLSDKWIFDNDGYSSNIYTISDSIIRLHNAHTNYTLKLYSSDSFSNSIMEHSVGKKLVSEFDTDLDYVAGFENGVRAYIGCSNSEPAHYLMSNTSQGEVYGTKYLSTDLTTFSITESENYQASEYDNELLTASGILATTNHPITFYFSNNSAQPDVEIDWIRVRSYDSNPPTIIINASQLVEDVLSFSKLYSIYTSGGGYVYTALTSSGVLNSAYINDIFVTEGTSSDGQGNVIFLATSRGAIILDEKRNDEANCVKKIYLLST